MSEVRLYCQLLPWARLTLIAILLASNSTATATAATATATAKAGCPTQCGKITVPYPFGIGLDGACSIGVGYNINCNTTYDPPMVFLEDTNLEIVDFSLADPEMRVKMYMTSRCYEKGELLPLLSNKMITFLNLHGIPLVISDTANKFTVIGCDNFGIITGEYGANDFSGGVISMCDGPEDVNNGSCSGSGCSQTSIPKGLKGFDIELGRVNASNVSYFNNCSYGFLGEYSKYTFNFSDLSDPGFMDRTSQNVPVVLEWTVGGNLTCSNKSCCSRIANRQNGCTRMFSSHMVVKVQYLQRCCLFSMMTSTTEFLAFSIQ